MTVVGIDVSKGKSMVAAMKPGGELVAAPNENSRYLILSTCHPTVPEKRCLLICVLSSIASTEYTGDGITPEDIPK